MAVYTFRPRGHEVLERVTVQNIVEGFARALEDLRSGEAVPHSVEDDGFVFDQQAIFRVYGRVP